jgi:hypothetical protein
MFFNLIFQFCGLCSIHASPYARSSTFGYSLWRGPLSATPTCSSSSSPTDATGYLVRPTPPVTAADAATKTVDDAAVHAYDHQVADFTVLFAYRDAQWCDEDARVVVVLTASVQAPFASQFMGVSTVSEMWDHLRHLMSPSTCLRSGPVRSMFFSRLTPLLMSCTHRYLTSA